jgi:hypothetical protein
VRIQSPSGSVEVQAFRDFFFPVIATIRVYLILSEIIPLRHISVLYSGVSTDLSPVADKVATPDINYEL